MVNLGITILLSVAVFVKPVGYKPSVPKAIPVETMVALEFSIIVAETVETNEIFRPLVLGSSVRIGDDRYEGILCEGYLSVELPPPK